MGIVEFIFKKYIVMARADLIDDARTSGQALGGTGKGFEPLPVTRS
jgi:hypothetical protein